MSFANLTVFLEPVQQAESSISRDPAIVYDLEFPLLANQLSVHCCKLREIRQTEFLRSADGGRAEGSFGAEHWSCPVVPRSALIAVMSTFNAGPNSYHVPMRLHAETRQKLVNRFKQLKHVPGGSLILLQGGKAQTRDATDHEPLFRQESFFQYLFGVKEPECWGVIDLSTNKATLFAPELGLEWVVWMGRVRPRKTYRSIWR